ncbi:MAG TPA: thioredoxin domain-containing protein [Nitrospirales bacterium]|jgi:protein-disulfide isomerase
MPRLLRILLPLVAVVVLAAPLRADESVLATVRDRAVTAQEIKQSLTIPLYDLEMEKYRLVRRALDKKIAAELLARAAAAAGRSVSAYVTEQLQAQLATLSDEEVEARFQQAIASGSKQPNKQQIRNQLLQERARHGLHLLLERLSDEANVSVSLRPPDPPVIQLTFEDDPAVGPPTAPVTIVEYGDFECPICKESVAILEQLRSLYPDQVRVVYRDFPLAAHPRARSAAEAAQCAYAQGEFWAYHDALYAHAPDLPNYVELAARLHLDTQTFNNCLMSVAPKAAVSKDLQEAERLGLSGTPTFFVNGRYMSGFQTLETMRQAVDRALLDAGAVKLPQPHADSGR